MKLTEVELKDFDELKKTIGATKAMGKTGDIDVNNQGFTNEQYEEKERLEKKPKKERTPEEQARLDELKAMSNQRRNAISILRGISIRMPLLIYGAELKNEEEITIHNFASLIDDQSWEEFMPKGVDKEKFEKFKKYYEPDVFREAGKRIREMARAADKFTIEERIERIATIFNTFRNPDKETVLTPWRVVNMHMSDCLGGWCFWDEDFKQMLSVPRYVDQGQVTKDVFRTDAHILEINSKSGLYPLYVAYNIYRSRVEEAKKKYGEVGIGFAKSLWDATIEENILVVCKTPMAKSITKRTLAGFRDTRVNAQYYKNLIENISERPEAVVNTFRDGKHFWKINNNPNMKLDAIVGNPPYQVITHSGVKGDQATPIYNVFVSFAKKLKPKYISMITPARWYNGGMGLNSYRDEMLKDRRLEIICDFQNAKDCFPSTNISGGICFFLWNENYIGKCDFINHIGDITISLHRQLDEFPVFIRDNRSIEIIEKIKLMAKNQLSNIVSPIMPYGLPSYARGETMPSDANRYKLYASNGVTYIKRENITQRLEVADKYKIALGQLISGHLGEFDENGQTKVFSSIFIMHSGEVCTASYLSIGAFNSLEECNYAFRYLKTKFVRFLVLQTLTSMHITRSSFSFVPLQDFTKSWTDEELYTKYGLTDEEIQFIESMIKPME